MIRKERRCALSRPPRAGTNAAGPVLQSATGRGPLAAPSSGLGPPRALPRSEGLLSSGPCPGFLPRGPSILAARGQHLPQPRWQPPARGTGPSSPPQPRSPPGLPTCCPSGAGGGASLCPTRARAEAGRPGARELGAGSDCRADRVLLAADGDPASGAAKAHALRGGRARSLQEAALKHRQAGQPGPRGRADQWQRQRCWYQGGRRPGL